MQSSMQRLLSKVASKHLAQDTLREAASLARPLGYPSLEVPAFPSYGRNVKWQEDWSEESPLVVRTGVTDRGALLTQHFEVWEPKRQKATLNRIRTKILTEPTDQLNLRSDSGIRNTMLVLRFLHDLEGRLDQMHASAEKEDDSSESDGDFWAASEIFCRPWIIAVDSNTELLRFEEFVDPVFRAFCGVLSLFGCAPFAVTAAWLQVQSPRAWWRLHTHRVFGPDWNPCKVHLDAGYRIEETGLSLREMAEAVARGRSISGMVSGAIPELAQN